MENWLNFQKPQQYQGNEWNVIKKNHTGKVTICLCFPDSYQIGMSNLGLRILYGLFNKVDEVVCERAFMPGSDLVTYLLNNKIKLFSLETKTSLDAFEIVGFNLSYELSYVNILAMLELSGIPLRAEQRTNNIVIGGGGANPESLAAFFDVFFLGEFEESAGDFIEILKKYHNKQARLEALAEYEGFYVPRFYQQLRTKNTYLCTPLRAHIHFPITRKAVSNLNDAFFPVHWLTPYTDIVHDRAQIEIARGCPHSCAFCQARCIYFPYRERSPERLFALLKKIYANSGYENVSLLSLSASNYSRIEELIALLSPFCEANKIGLSLPSLRVDDIVGRLYKVLQKIKRIPATFAVEAARDELRERLNKKIDIEKLFEAARIIKSLHAKHIKLYFMYGFDNESDEDLTAIGQLASKLQRMIKIRLHISINIFVPKPFSKLENKAFLPDHELLRRQNIIMHSFPRGSSIKTSTSAINESKLETIISRADRRLGEVLLKVHQMRFKETSWQEIIDWDFWEEAFRVCNLDYHEYLQEQNMPASWSFIQLYQPKPTQKGR